MTKDEAREYLRKTLAEAAPTWHAAEAVRVLVEDSAPSTVDRDALLAEAVDVFERIMRGLDGSLAAADFLRSPSLAAWRRESGRTK